MSLHKNINIELILKVVLFYVVLSFPQKVQQGLFSLFVLCSTRCFCSICKILSIKHSEQLQTWRVQSQTCSDQDMLVSHTAWWQYMWLMLFLFIICQLQLNAGMMLQ